MTDKTEQLALIMQLNKLETQLHYYTKKTSLEEFMRLVTVVCAKRLTTRSVRRTVDAKELSSANTSSRNLQTKHY